MNESPGSREIKKYSFVHCLDRNSVAALSLRIFKVAMASTTLFVSMYLFLLATLSPIGILCMPLSDFHSVLQEFLAEEALQGPAFAYPDIRTEHHSADGGLPDNVSVESASSTVFDSSSSGQGSAYGTINIFAVPDIVHVPDTDRVGHQQGVISDSIAINDVPNWNPREGVDNATGGDAFVGANTMNASLANVKINSGIASAAVALLSGWLAIVLPVICHIAV